MTLKQLNLVHSRSEESFFFFRISSGGINDDPAGWAVDEADGVVMIAEAETVDEVSDIMDGVALVGLWLQIGNS